jgi:catechol 2,3-dioxygenase-like lactoylglutathione lyase family enzyme
MSTKKLEAKKRAKSSGDATASLEGFTLLVSDLERSFDYYSKIPGAIVLHHSKGSFAMFRIGDRFRLGLLESPSKGFHMELESQNLDGVYAKMAGSTSSRISPPAKRPWRERSFTASDPDGYQLEFEDGGGER